MDKINRIKELVELLNHYRNEYYNNQNSEISDFEYDSLFDELTDLELETGFIIATSPTQTVGYEVKSELTKVKHNHPMLSLDKTKDVDEIKSFIGNKDWVAMLKMDGLTCSLLYENGQLVRAETRGDGEIGEDITHNAMVIPSIPKKISYTDRLVVDGEIICKLDDFEEFSDEYKNARNFASGSIRLLDSNECSKRKLTFVAWDAIGNMIRNKTSYYLHLSSKLEALWHLGFETTSWLYIEDGVSIEDAIENLKTFAKDRNYPIDGIVFKYDNCAEYEAEGRTEHHFRGGLAFKFYNELYETKLTDIEWTLGKTGVLTPTAIFKTVQIDGCDISRASLHNISIIKKLGLTNNCTVKISKRNEIIPQVEECLQDGNSDIKIPKYCPVCGGETEVVKENESEILMCTNPQCSGKLLGRLKFFVSKPAVNIDGLSEATLEFLINQGWVKNFKDIYYLYQYGREWEQLDGFGEKSVAKILDAIDRSRKIKLENFICALSIDGVGKSAAKTLAHAFGGDINAVLVAFKTGFDWSTLDDCGIITAKSINDYFTKNIEEVYELSKEFNFIVPDVEVVAVKDNPFAEKNVAVTGKLVHFTRDSINAKLESLGARPASGVTTKTHYLINNDPTSSSSKNKKANELNIPIITEEEFLKMIGE